MDDDTPEWVRFITRIRKKKEQKEKDGFDGMTYSQKLKWIKEHKDLVSY